MRELKATSRAVVVKKAHTLRGFTVLALAVRGIRGDLPLGRPEPHAPPPVT